MADISKIQISNIEYNLKDAVARQRNIPAGGTTGQVLKKNSSTNYDADWDDESGGEEWGSIGGDISDQTDLQNALSERVSKSGDSVTGVISHILSNIDVDGTASTSVYEWIEDYRDKDETVFGRLEGYQYAGTADEIGLKIGVGRTINGTNYDNGLYVGIGSSGESVFHVDNADAFRNAIGVNPSITNGVPSDISVGNNTMTTVGNFTLTPGLYIIIYGARFAENSTGFRQICLAETTSGDAIGHLWNQIVRAVSGAGTIISMTICESIQSNTTRYMRVRQNSGGSLTVTPRWQIVKLMSY